MQDRMRLLLVGLLLVFRGWELRPSLRRSFPLRPPPRANRFYSPGVDAGDYVYVSGQGPRRPDGSLPATFAAQARQALDNVKSVVEAAGLTMDHVVYTQVYLEDISKYAEMNQVFAEAFSENSAGASGARRGQTSRTIDSDQCRRGARSGGAAGGSSAGLQVGRTSFSPGILTADRLFVSGMPGSDPASGKVPDDPAAQVDFALDRMKAVVEAAGLDLRHMVFVNPYLTADVPTRIMNQHYAQRFEFGNTPARATIEVSSLPEGAHIEYTGVAVRDLKQRQAVRPKNMPPSPTASPVCFRRRHSVLFGQERLHSRTARRRLCLHHRPSTAADHAQSPRQPGRSRHEFRPGSVHQCLSG